MNNRSNNNIVANFARNLNNQAKNITSPIVNLVNTNLDLNSNSNMISKWYIWVAVVGAIVVTIMAIKYFIIDEGTISSFLDLFRSEKRRGLDAAPPPIEPPQPPPAVHPDTVKDAWCFVGEDVTGRYCVNVPSAKSCEPSRIYSSRQECEMVPGHALPAAISTKQGAASIPLLSAN
jgi:hypothetical protein